MATYICVGLGTDTVVAAQRTAAIEALAASWNTDTKVCDPCC